MGTPSVTIPTLPRAAERAAPEARARRERLLRSVGRPAAGLLLAALALRLVLVGRAYGFEQGDPIEYVNIAYKIAFGIGIPWWDLRPLMLPLIYVPVLYLAQWWPDPTGEAMVLALRLVGVAFSVGTVWLVYLLGRRLGGETVGLVGGLLVAVNPVFNRYSVSTYAEIPSMFFVLLAIWLLSGARTARRWALAGLALGIACMIRYQAIAFLLPIGVWALGVTVLGLRQPWRHPDPLPCHPPNCHPERSEGSRVREEILRSAQDDRGGQDDKGGGQDDTQHDDKGGAQDDDRAVPGDILLDVTRGARGDRRGAPLVGLGAGLAAAVLAQAIIEVVAYGRPFHSLLVSFEYNVTSGQAPVQFGAEPFEWFLLQVPDWFGVVPALLAGLGLAALWRGPLAAEWRLVGLTAGTMFVFLSALPHKEVRFMAQVTPLLAPFAGYGVRLVGGRWITGGGRALVTTVVAGALTVVAAGPLLWASLRLDLVTNASYVDGPKRAAAIKPGGMMGTIPWLVPRPYAGTRLALERMDRNIWNNREHVARVVEEADFLLFPEYWLLEDREVDRMVDPRFRTIESYDNGVVLLQNRRLDEPARRRPR